jgi:hypothetical protein
MGEAIEAVLDETSPYLAANAVHKGKKFSHVYDVDENYFTYDIVTEPSAGTYVDASESVVKAVESLIEAKVLSERTRQVLRETTVAVEKVAEPVVVETPAQEDEKMDEITVESLKAAHPEVVEAIKAEVKPAITEEEVAKLREQAAKATELAETLMREKTEREMAQSMKAALVSALEETVEGVDQIHKALRPYVEQLVVVERFEKPEDVVSEVKRVAAVVKAVNDESKAGSAVPAKALDDDAKVESKEQKIVSRTREAMTALLGENYRNVFKQNRG